MGELGIGHVKLALGTRVEGRANRWAGTSGMRAESSTTMARGAQHPGLKVRRGPAIRRTPAGGTGAGFLFSPQTPLARIS